MSTRCSFRRKVVLGVTVIRRNGRERQLVHTFDITETSARLGGLNFMLEPGEIIELQRGASRAKFQVVWMGLASSPNERQAGVRSMEPSKVIWNVDLPDDELDPQLDISNVRNSASGVAAAAMQPAQKSVRQWPEAAAAQATPPPSSAKRPELYAPHVLVTIIETLTANFDEWRSNMPSAEIQELRERVLQLQRLLSPPHKVEIMDFLATTVQRNGTA